MNKTDIIDIIKEELDLILQEPLTEAFDWDPTISNIDRTWKSVEDMEQDLDAYVKHAYMAGGYDLLDDLVSSLEQRVKAYRVLRKREAGRQ
tara:strand:+ start:232 stop:504 length:273 start_codon:yes stop_codon:yes gene_type:complete